MTALKCGIDIVLEERERLSQTLENLSRVTSVVLLKKVDNSALFVEKVGSGEDFMVIDNFEGIEGIKQVGVGGIKTIVGILEKITGEKFISVKDDEEELHYRREDISKAIELGSRIEID